ncbi:type 1 glutamine amidotransferase domain-containing protein [Natronoglycomyces albus]|uniref:Type 1 glutamine amidotransferase domain-containing protein n=1 Tax=Natronoglycomyces albus TaxID=2811108 RepID=A0A895XQX6_9ACTN|nr:type 1 glutamine amidotransferase domain-containing protein [Natronoglycomyces albus]QSB06122.1 type 1 glutamine amidotransferase domain-containing protein [Natronoglycomyces albus]
MAKVLFVVTGADSLTLSDGDSHPTGFWAEELVTPYRALVENGHEVDFATPDGVEATVDQASLTADANGGEEGAAAIADELAQIDGLRNPLSIGDINIDGYDAVFYPGGHGPMEDLASSPSSGRLLARALDTDKIVATVCHGPAALLAVPSRDGISPLRGRNVTGFSNQEEGLVGLGDKVMWRLEDQLRKSGAVYSHGPEWAANVVVDRNLISGQNPASTNAVAKELLQRLG